MIDLEFMERLIRAFDESSVDSLEIERGGTRVRLAKTPPVTVTQAAQAVPAVPVAAAPSVAPGAASSAPAPAAVESAEDLTEITSPMVGTFYRAPAPDAPPYVEEGSRVGIGETLCIIEAMKLMNELESEVKGTVAEICVENGQPVEFGQVLFRVRPG